MDHHQHQDQQKQKQKPPSIEQERRQNLRVIRQAMTATPSFTLRFRYMDGKGNVSEREAEPYELKGDTLFAHCLDRDAIRQFKLHGMEQVATGRPFTPRTNPKTGHAYQIVVPM